MVSGDRCCHLVGHILGSSRQERTYENAMVPIKSNGHISCAQRSSLKEWRAPHCNKPQPAMSLYADQRISRHVCSKAERGARTGRQCTQIIIGPESRKRRRSTRHKGGTLSRGYFLQCTSLSIDAPTGTLVYTPPAPPHRLHYLATSHLTPRP